MGKLYEDKINLFGKKVTYETYKLPIYDENNNLKYIVGSCKDTSLQNIAKDEKYTNNDVSDFRWIFDTSTRQEE